MTSPVFTPLQMFYSTSGLPLTDGYIYIGTASQNPQTNPIAVYWDAAGTIPAAQPIRTSGGYPVRNGSPATVFVLATDFSLIVRDKSSKLVFSRLSGNAFSAEWVTYTPAGTGAVATTVQAKLRESVSVKDFGAKGDGVTDDSAAFNAAWLASKTIRVPAGMNCKISAVAAPQNATIIGDGFHSKITCTSGNAIVSAYAGADFLTVSGLHFVLTNSATALSIARSTLANCTKLTLTNNWFEGADTSGSAALVSAGISEGLISGNLIFGPSGYTATMNAFVFASNATSFNLNLNITNNYAYDIKDFVNATNSVDAYFYANAGFRIVNNMCLGLTGYGVYSVNADWVLVEQNMFDYVAYPAYLKNTINPKVRHNYFAANQDNPCVYVETNSTATLLNLDYVEVISNRVFNYRKALATGPGNDGIVLKATAPAMNQVQVTGNTIDNCITAINFNTAGAATIVGGVIRDNIIRSCSAGVNLGAQTAANIVEGNSIKDVGSNYVIGSTAQNSIGQNIFNTSPTRRYGKLVTNGNGSTQVFTVAHNMTQTPTWASATLGAPSGGAVLVGYDATLMYFTFSPAPPSGTNNVVVNWEAKTFI